MISVVIGTFGSERWRDLAWSRAYQSVPSGVEAVVEHGETLAKARNEGAAKATHPWLCFLDADDELGAGYLHAMWDMIRKHGAPDRMFTPRVQYMRGSRKDGDPFFHRKVDPHIGNWLVIGTVIPRALFDQVGGFEEWEKYEDWALFARMQKTGAHVVRVPDAVYVAHRHTGENGRNHIGGRDAAVRAHEAIRRAVFPELYP